MCFFLAPAASWPQVLEKTPFLEGFCQFFVLFFAFSRAICMYKAFFAKKIGPFDLLWPQERPLQSSATYRGLPLPAMSTYKYKRHSRAICQSGLVCKFLDVITCHVSIGRDKLFTISVFFSLQYFNSFKWEQLVSMLSKRYEGAKRFVTMSYYNLFHYNVTLPGSCVDSTHQHFGSIFQ